MSITDELRDWVANHYSGWTSKQAKGFAIADRIDEAVASKYVKLPVDSDGVPICVGDRIEYLTGGRDVVRFLTLNDSGWTVNGRGWEPFTMHHYHKPTVENVLREFAEGVQGQNKGFTELVITEYAEKLREAIEHERD